MIGSDGSTQQMAGTNHGSLSVQQARRRHGPSTRLGTSMGWYIYHPIKMHIHKDQHILLPAIFRFLVFKDINDPITIHHG